MAWTDPTLNTMIKIRDVHVNELRSAVENLEAACATHDSTYNSTKYNTVNSTAYSSIYSSKYGTIYSSNNPHYGGTAMSSGNGTYWPGYYYAGG